MLKIDIISGFLGAGKTTFIKRILNTNLKNEKIVLIENEFGEVNVDGDFLKESQIDIAEISQGCICCSLVGDFSKSLAEVIDKFNPDRIIIEPSGVGKLSDVKKAIVEAKLGNYLNTFVCLVDASKAKVYAKNFKEFFADQIANAKTVILSRTDVVKEDKLLDALEVVRSINHDCNVVVTPIAELSDEELLTQYEGVKSSFVEDVIEEVESHHHHDHECECHHEHHHHDHECKCHHEHHHHDHECECHHEHHHHDHECECHHEHHHHHDHECGCGCHHEHHHADEVFQTVGFEVVKTYDYDNIKETLHKLAYTLEFGQIVRAKGIIKTNLGWKKFNITPEELLIEDNEALSIGKVCVIGIALAFDLIKESF